MNTAKLRAVLAAVGMVLIAGGIAFVDWRGGIIALGTLLLLDARTPTPSPGQPER